MHSRYRPKHKASKRPYYRTRITQNLCRLRLGSRLQAFVTPPHKHFRCQGQILSLIGLMSGQGAKDLTFSGDYIVPLPLRVSLKPVHYHGRGHCR